MSTPPPRPKSFVVPVASGNDPNEPSYVRPELIAVAPELDLVHSLLGGTTTMQSEEVRQRYIRKWKDEDTAVYNIRSRAESVFEGLGRTLSASVGMLFAKPPDLEWGASEAAMKEHWANIDGAGNAGPVFVKRFAERSLRDGIGAILVDHPGPPLDEQGNPVTVTGGNETQLGLVPTWAAYPRHLIVNWDTGRIAGQEVLTKVVFREVGWEREGTYGVKPKVQYRILELTGSGATWQIMVEREEGGKTVFQQGGNGVYTNRTGQMAERLPVALAYTGRSEGIMDSTVPLMGVAYANLSHWQISTDLRFYLSLCAYPQPTVTGKLVAAPSPAGATVTSGLKLGPGVVVHLEEGGEYTWTELQGTSLERLEAAIREKERQMANLGVSFLATDTRAAETAEAKRLDATAENSTLATAAQGIDDCVNLALEIHGWYLGIDKADVPTFTLNRDFENTAMSPDVMRAYVEAVQRAGLPKRLLLEAWQQGGRIGPDVNLDELELEMMASDRAREEAAQLEAEQRRQALENAA